MEEKTVGRLYVWLICHDFCPCQWTARLHLRKGGVLDNLCDWLEHRYFKYDPDVEIAPSVVLEIVDKDQEVTP